MVSVFSLRQRKLTNLSEPTAQGQKEGKVMLIVPEKAVMGRKAMLI